MPVRCPENEELATFMRMRRQEMAAQPKGLSDRKDMILSKAYSNICNSKAPIITLKDFAKVKYACFCLYFLQAGRINKEK